MGLTETLDNIAKPSEMVEFYLIDADGTADLFETEQVITDTPTETLITDDPRVKRFEIFDIIFMVNPTAAETPEIILFEGAVDDDVTSLSKIVWTSGAGMVDSTRYIRSNNEDELPKIVNLDDEGVFYIMTIWTGTPGNTPGYFRARGRKLA